MVVEHWKQCKKVGFGWRKEKLSSIVRVFNRHIVLQFIWIWYLHDTKDLSQDEF